MYKNCAQLAHKPATSQWTIIHSLGGYAQTPTRQQASAGYNPTLSPCLYGQLQPTLYTQSMQLLPQLHSQLYPQSTPPTITTTKYNKE